MLKTARLRKRKLTKKRKAKDRARRGRRMQKVR